MRGNNALMPVFDIELGALDNTMSNDEPIITRQINGDVLWTSEDKSRHLKEYGDIARNPYKGEGTSTIFQICEDEEYDRYDSRGSDLIKGTFLGKGGNSSDGEDWHYMSNKELLQFSITFEDTFEFPNNEIGINSNIDDLLIKITEHQHHSGSVGERDNPVGYGHAGNPPGGSHGSHDPPKYNDGSQKWYNSAQVDGHGDKSSIYSRIIIDKIKHLSTCKMGMCPNLFKFDIHKKEEL